MKLILSTIRNLHVRTCGKFINHAQDVMRILKSIKKAFYVKSKQRTSAWVTKANWLKIKLNDIVSSDDEQFCLLCAELRSNWSEAKWWMTSNLDDLAKTKNSPRSILTMEKPRRERFTRLDSQVVCCNFCFRYSTQPRPLVDLAQKRVFCDSKKGKREKTNKRRHI